jgi:WD40 repeat protein
VTPDSSRAVSASLDQTCKVWDLRSGRLLKNLAGNYGESFRNLVITPDGRFLAATANVLNRRVRLWNLAKGRRRLTFWFHRGDIDALAVMPDGCIVSGGQDGTVRLWDPVSRLPVRTLRKHENWVCALAVSPNGAHVVSGSWDETVKIWDARSGEELHTLRGHEARIRTVGVTPDGRRVLSDGDDGTLRVWDARDGREVLRLQSHTHFEGDAHGAAPIAITSDGRYAIGDRTDRTLAVWDLETGDCALRFPRPAPVDHVATQDDLIVAGDQAGFVHVLRMHSLELAPRIVTASEDGYRCPSCGARQGVAPDDLGTIVACPACERPLRLNPFFARSAGESRWWWRLWH